MPQYRKLHVKSVDSQDINDMPDDFTRLLWVLLPLGLDSEGRGIYNAGWVKAKVFPLREDVTNEMVSIALEWLCNRKMIVRYDTFERSYFHIPTWHVYQGATDKEAKSVIPAPPECNKKRRSKSRVAPELLQSKSMSDADADADANTDANTDAGLNRAPTRGRKSDERTQTPAIQTCYKTVGRYPPLGLYDKLIGALGNAPDIQRLTECRTIWLERGYNPNAWTWAIEWYVSGVPSRNGNKQSGSSKIDRATAKTLELLRNQVNGNA